MDKLLHFLSVWFSENGDTTFWSWIITILYAVTFLTSLYYVYKIRNDRKSFFLWVCISLFVFVMGINKQLDVQILLAMIWRYLEHHLDLYRYRRIIFHLVITGLFTGFLAAVIIVIVKTGKTIFKSILSITGIFILMLFVLMRAGYFHVPRIHSIELLGIGLVFIDLILKIKNLRFYDRSASSDVKSF